MVTARVMALSAWEIRTMVVVEDTIQAMGDIIQTHHHSAWS